MIVHTEFDLTWTTPWPDEEDLFLKILFREIQKIRNEILTFFLGKLYQKYFLLYTFITLVILDTGLVWIEQLLEPMKKTYF